MSDKPLACPACGCFTSKVMDSRPHPYKPCIRRRRKCTRCGQTYETHEAIVARGPDRRQSSSNVIM